jgi:hypothetical protein
MGENERERARERERERYIERKKSSLDKTTEKDNNAKK